MESMRDINRVMEREIAKGSCPLKLDHIEFGDYSYQEITSKEKLLEVLSYLLRIGDFKQYAGKTILNNVYMDLRGKKPVFKRTKTAMERNNIFAAIRRYAKKLKPQYNGDVYLETVRCYFDIPQENLEKCRYTYQGNETYAFLMSDKYIMFNYNKQAISDILTDSFSNFNPHVDSEMIREKVDDKIQNEMFASQIVELSNEVVNELNDLGVTVIEFETQGKLITSDMPVVMTNPFSIDNAGMANVGVVMMYPISEKVLILIYDSKIYTSLKQYMKDDNEEDVVSLNKYQVLSAEERIMSDKLENLVAIMQDRDVCEKREKFREKKKVDSSYDGVGTFFAMHSRSMKYSFPISFFKLPRAIRKIPVECREAFRRKYDRDNRIALLCRIYRLPDLLKDNKDFPKSEIRKQKEGYSKLLKFMDDYWEVPITERTITPELMHKLKTVPTTYYPLDNR